MTKFASCDVPMQRVRTVISICFSSLCMCVCETSRRKYLSISHFPFYFFFNIVLGLSNAKTIFMRLRLSDFKVV